MERTVIPKATLGRLPEYRNLLKSLPGDGQDHISATAIAKMLHLGEVQVRKDLNAVSGGGKPKIGYVREELLQRIEEVLTWDGQSAAVLVGAGRLGNALLEYDGFETYGVKILAGFDRDEQVIRPGRSKHLLPMSQFDAFCQTNAIRIGIITVGKESAQEVCDRMVQNGITALWNFAPCALKVPAGVFVKQEQLALSLAHLKNQLSNIHQEEHHGKDL